MKPRTCLNSVWLTSNLTDSLPKSSATFKICMSCVIANLTQKQTHQFNKKKTDSRQTKKQSSLHSCSESLLKWLFCLAGLSKIIYTSPWLYLLIVVFFLALIYTGMWNQIFLGSYMSLFVAIPFAYFFMESEGFAGSRKVNCV